jgi:hypothetical protein
VDTIRWYIKGLLDQPFAPTYDYFQVPTVTGTGWLGMVQIAALNHYNAVNNALYSDQAAARNSWIECRDRVLGWLRLLDAGDDFDWAAEELLKVPEVCGDGRERTTTIYDSLDEIAVLEGRLNADRVSLKRAIAFYLGAVDHAVTQFVEFVEARDDPVEQKRFAEHTVSMIEQFTRRIEFIQQALPAGSGQRPLA